MRQLLASKWLVSALVTLGLVFVLPISVLAADTPPAPKVCPVQDIAAVIDDASETALCTKLLAYETKTGNQIAVLTIKSLNGEDIEGYANRVARAWGVGDKNANNGVLFVAAINDHKMRIEVGRGLEPMLTDVQSNQIIVQKIRPFFQKDNYSAGITAGTDSMIAVIGGERLSEPKSSNIGEIGGVMLFLLQFAFIPFIYLASFLARSKSWWGGGVIGAIPGVFVLFSHLLVGAIALVTGFGLGLLFDFLLSKNYQVRKAKGDKTDWWNSGGGFFGGSSGSSSSGGWGGFGGGDFGGGGSSGSW